MFIRELTSWLEHFNRDSEYKYIALKVYMILSSLLLQKPTHNSKAKDHNKKIEERLSSWKGGRIMDLVKEGTIIQEHIRSSCQRVSKDYAKIFANLMMQSRVSSALKILSSDPCVGIHKINDDVINALRQKHPKPSPIIENTLNGPVNEVLLCYFDNVDEEMVSSLTKGAGGPSQLDAMQYHHLLSSRKYKVENKELRKQIAVLTRKLATETLDPLTLEAYVSCRLIPLAKNPGVRPIDVGEVLRRIVGKCVGWVLKEDIQLTAGPLQTTTGLQSGAETGIHSMRCMFEDDRTDAVILVDTRNAFNSLNRQAALHNIRVICPQIANILVNTYRRPALLIILGASDIYSLGGTTQGDNLAMAFYALGTTPLVNTLQITSPEVRQVCLADDISGAGSLDDLITWWKNVISEGKKFGYLVNEKKNWLILKDHGNLQEAQHLFSSTDIKLTTDGQRHLGAAIANSNFRAQYAAEKVTKWCNELHRLADFAKTQPQATYSTFTHGILSQYTYFMRTIPGMHKFIKPVDVPALLNSIVPEVNRQLYSLPLRHGGLGIPILSEITESQFEASQAITLPLVTIMITQGNKLPNKTEVNEIKHKITNEREVRISE